MSCLREERNRYQPRIPKKLEEITSLRVEVEEAPILTKHPRELEEIFPKTFHQPLLKFSKAEEKSARPLKVGVVLSGGQAPGGHNVIAGLFDSLKKIDSRSTLYGFLGGSSGIVEDRLVELTEEKIRPYRNTGGFDLLGSGRTKIETPEQLESALQNVKAHALDGLVIIGGDDSNTNAALLAEYFLTHNCETKVIGVPKTIDGDLKNAFVEIPFGFDTACKTYSALIGNIARDALSAKKYYHFIKIMGRSASHIALECALQTHPNYTLIGEEVASTKGSLEEIVQSLTDLIVERAERGKNYGVVLIPEGLIEFIPEMRTLIQELNLLMSVKGEELLKRLSEEARKTFLMLPEIFQEQLTLDRDPHGNIQVSHIATEQLLLHLVKRFLKNRADYKGKFQPVSHFFGYEGRSCFPSNFDSNYGYGLGFVASSLIFQGYTGYMGVLQNLASSPEEWEPAGIPITMLMHLEERKGRQKPVIEKTLVDLKGKPFTTFSSLRGEWALEDEYHYPGPVQFYGPPSLCNEKTFTLALEQETKVGIHG
ncbi:MAG: Pyrophosphate--fructose 6-phosphate 1-phosphotransferase [Chlamydiae bacterium]|nr:Pyrophosphate--fructose 6-phosphate 1-phosphotransferase [Chlamydiota bacterium]